VNATELISCGEEAVSAVGSALLAGAPLVKCQLLASRFYEGVKQELAAAGEADGAYSSRLAAAAQCLRSADRGVSPTALLLHLRAAVAMLDEAEHAAIMSRSYERPRPVLRVIQGGLS
jgi:hypothetical protein